MFLYLFVPLAQNKITEVVSANTTFSFLHDDIYHIKRNEGADLEISDIDEMWPLTL